MTQHARLQVEKNNCKQTSWGSLFQPLTRQHSFYDVGWYASKNHPVAELPIILEDHLSLRVCFLNTKYSRLGVFVTASCPPRHLDKDLPIIIIPNWIPQKQISAAQWIRTSDKFHTKFQPRISNTVPHFFCLSCLKPTLILSSKLLSLQVPSPENCWFISSACHKKTENSVESVQFIQIVHVFFQYAGYIKI